MSCYMVWEETDFRVDGPLLESKSNACITGNHIVCMFCICHKTSQEVGWVAA